MTNPSHSDPSKDYPPTRPTWRMLLVALVVVGAAVTLVNWAKVSAYAHISQIESELQRVVGI